MGLIGDSVPFQAFRHYDKTIERDRRIAFNEIGLAYRIRTVLPAVRSAIRRDRLPPIFVAFIGTAESKFDPPSWWRHELEDLLDLVSPHVDCIRVFDIDDNPNGVHLMHDRNAPTYNRITRQVTSRYANAEWFHYSLWADLAGPALERPDQLHHNGAGQVRLARLMREVTNSCDPALTSGPFWDVPDRHPAAEEIAWVGERNLFPGYANGTYRAEVGGFTLHATRGVLLNMAWKLAGRPTGFGPHPWSDGRRSLDPALRWAAATRVGTGLARRHLPARPAGQPRPGPRPALAHGRAPQRVPGRSVGRRRGPDLPLGGRNALARRPHRDHLRPRRPGDPRPAGHPAVPLRPTT